MIDDSLVIVTTTNSVEGYRIVRYFPPVVRNVVAGTGLITELIASFSDTFGGRSQTYQRQLDDMYAEATTELQREASRIGANALGKPREFNVSLRSAPSLDC